ncbi:MAG: hypothetical protein H6581_27160 [Bacteroidia bacterium]|nr:hypothetical protein [Bacteroidia bacterium]
MKKILFVILLACLSTFANAQSLSFDQVLFEEYSITIPPNTAYFNTVGNSTLVVPAGKVLKIESIQSGYLSSTVPRPLNALSYFDFFINDKWIYPNYSTSGVLSDFPIWLPAGSYDLKYLYGYGSTTSSTLTVKWSLSGVQFNVVP